MSQIEVELLDIMGNDETVAQTAWVSSGRGEGKDYTKLVERLAKEGHETPFESIVMRWYIKVPQRIGVQILRHRMASHNCASARYNHKFDEMFDILEVTESKRETDLPCMDIMYMHAVEAVNKYNRAIEELKDHPDRKRLRELAAMCLPQGVMTQQIMTINMRSFKNFYKLRSSPHAQKEIQDVANMMLYSLEQVPGSEYTVKHFIKGD